MNFMPRSKEGLPSPLIASPILSMKHAHLVQVIALGGMLAAMALPLLAQYEELPLTLRKGDSVATIPIGAGIVVTSGGVVLVEGLLQQWDSEYLVIKRWLHRDAFILLDQVGTIFHVNSAKYTMRAGITKGAVWGLVIGLPLGLIEVLGGDPLDALTGAPMTISMITVPIGAAIGYSKGVGPVQERYPIGPGEWELVVEQSTAE